MLTRREILAGAMAAMRPTGILVDSHIHLFDPARFPYHPNAPYKPPAQTLENYLKFASQAGIAHAVIVHPEPYQDDHRYLEYCFAHEPSSDFFKGTCLFDPIAPETPGRMEALVKSNPGRIVALRIHEMHKPGTPSSMGGAIKDRDMHSHAMAATWRKADSLGLSIQMHFLPHYAPEIGELAAKFPRIRVLLDHLARGWQGTPAEFDGVLRLARNPRIYIKYSAVTDVDAVKPLVRRAFDAFGADRMMWGGLGHSMQEFERKSREFDATFDFASEPDRAKIRGLNALKVYRW